MHMQTVNAKMIEQHSVLSSKAMNDRIPQAVLQLVSVST